MVLEQDIRDIKRLKEIFKILCNEILHYIKYTHEGDYQEAVSIREAFERLGPTFIKFGQMLSLRTDLIPPAYCREFTKLQDEVSPIPFSIIRKEIEHELKGSLSSLFLTFQKKPLSSASISQVHLASLKSGEKVAVKVRRPGIEKQMKTDLDILLHLARALEHNHVIANLGLVSLIREFEDSTSRELHFPNESKNLLRFYSYFRDWGDVRTPKVYEKFTTDNVLVMEYIAGCKLNDTKAIKKRVKNLKTLAKTGFKAIFYQIFDLGIFHADPHPANLILDKEGRLAFIDFGIVGKVSEPLQDAILKVVLYLIKPDVEKAIDRFLFITVCTEKSDIVAFKKQVQKLILDWYGATMEEARFTTLLFNIIRCAIKHDIKVPSDVVLMVKAMITIEGTGSIYDAEFNLVKETRPYIKEIILKKFEPSRILEKIEYSSVELEDFFSSLVQHSDKLLNRLDEDGIRVKVEPREIEQITSSIDRNAFIRSLSLLTGFVFLGSVFLMQEPVYFYGVSIGKAGLSITMLIAIIIFAIFLNDLLFKRKGGA